MSERIWCVPAALVAEAFAGRVGFVQYQSGPAHDHLLTALSEAGRFLPRAEVETDETWRQVIPYVLLRDAAGRYFAYRRLPASGEGRLVGLHSLGVGGHLNDEHLAADLAIGSPVLRPNPLAVGLQRELAEELVLPSTTDGPLGRLAIHGFLALDATPVDRVHVGVVVILSVAGDYYTGCDVRETDKLAAVGWFAPDVLRLMSAEVEFEGWSRTLIAAGLPADDQEWDHGPIGHER